MVHAVVDNRLSAKPLTEMVDIPTSADQITDIDRECFEIKVMPTSDSTDTLTYEGCACDNDACAFLSDALRSQGRI